MHASPELIEGGNVPLYDLLPLLWWHIVQKLIQNRMGIEIRTPWVRKIRTPHDPIYPHDMPHTN